MTKFQRNVVRTFSAPTDDMLVHVQFGFVLGVLFAAVVALVFFRLTGGV